MGQVPARHSYLIIGGGRSARHLARYFELENIPYSKWQRSDGPANFEDLVRQATRVLIAISDSAIEPFHGAHPSLASKTCVHLSGALVSPKIPSAHPLMTFAKDTDYDLATYRSIPFVTERGRGSLSELLPGLSNTDYSIDGSKKPLYHALCVLSGNFSVLLWEKAFREFSETLSIPREALIPYMNQVFENLRSAPEGQSVLTGPLARGDRTTIEAHLRTLEGDPFQNVYRALAAAHEHSRRLKNDSNRGETK